MKFLSVLFVLAFLPGCVKLGEQQARQADEIVQEFHDLKKLVAAAPAALKSNDEAVRADIAASNNATQQSLTGLGAQVAKIGEHVEAAVAKIEANVEASVLEGAQMQVEAQAQISAKLAAHIQNEVEATFQMQTHANLEAIAELKTEIRAMAAGAQVGWKNSIEQTSQTITAQRDANTQNIQFTTGMANLLAEAFASVIQAVLILASVITTINGVFCALMLRTVSRMATLAERVDSDPTPASKKETVKHVRIPGPSS